jgi:hypothetical protein
MMVCVFRFCFTTTNTAQSGQPGPSSAHRLAHVQGPFIHGGLLCADTRGPQRAQPNPHSEQAPARGVVVCGMTIAPLRLCRIGRTWSSVMSEL